MSIRFDGRVVVISGGAMGIGEATARKFAELGARVAILDLDAKAGKRVVASTKGACFYRCDVAEGQQVKKAIAAVARDFTGIDVLVSNAGIQRYGDVVETSEDLWREVISTNLDGCFHLLKYGVPELVKRGGGAVVAVGSVQSFTAVGNSAAYVASKHALVGLVRSVALDYAKHNIRANCVCPGAIDTPMLHWAASLDPNPQKVIETCNRMHALGRIGRPEEVANAVAFLASDWASFITGATLLVDGGMLVPTGGIGFQESGTGAVVKKK